MKESVFVCCFSLSTNGEILKSLKGGSLNGPAILLFNNSSCTRRIHRPQEGFRHGRPSTICRKLELYGIHGIAHNWITSYLDNHSQFVSIDGYSSDIQTIKCGVP